MVDITITMSTHIMHNTVNVVMFSELIFVDHLNKVEGTQLPADVLTDTGDLKREFSQLEVCHSGSLCD